MQSIYNESLIFVDIPIQIMNLASVQYTPSERKSSNTTYKIFIQANIQQQKCNKICLSSPFKSKQARKAQRGNRNLTFQYDAQWYMYIPNISHYAQSVIHVCFPDFFLRVLLYTPLIKSHKCYNYSP